MEIEIKTNAKRYEVVVDDDGKFTFPAEILGLPGFQKGEALTAVETSEGILLMPLRVTMPELTREFSQIMEEEGITLDDLLQSLEEVRTKRFKERYGNKVSS